MTSSSGRLSKRICLKPSAAGHWSAAVVLSWDSIRKLAEEKQVSAAAIEAPDGTILTGKTSELLGPCAAVLLNTLKHLAGINDEIHLIAPSAITPIQTLKVNYLGSKNPRLHTDEVLIALSVSATNDANARLALEQLPKLKGLQAHSTVMISNVDLNVFKKLGVQLTCEPVWERQKQEKTED